MWDNFKKLNYGTSKILYLKNIFQEYHYNPLRLTKTSTWALRLGLGCGSGTSPMQYCSGVTKGPAYPAVGDDVLVFRGRQIVVWMWDNFEKLNLVLSTITKLRVLIYKHTFLEILPAYPLKSSNLFNFRKECPKERGANRGRFFSEEGANVTPLHTVNLYMIQQHKFDDFLQR